jgi:glutamate/tyrosine decarboxylase-like PLP-dependent enzyme
MFFCRHANSVGETFRAENPYMPRATPGDVGDPYTSSVQWSRRFIGLKLFLSLAHEGEAGCVERIEHQARMGALLRQLLKNSGWQIVNNTPLPLVCFTRDGLDVAEFLARLQNDQIAWMSETRLRGIPVIRACVTSYRTTADDISWVVTQMNRIAMTEGSK